MTYWRACKDTGVYDTTWSFVAEANAIAVTDVVSAERIIRRPLRKSIWLANIDAFRLGGDAYVQRIEIDDLTLLDRT